MAQPVECYVTHKKALSSISSTTQARLVAQTCNLSTQEVRTGSVGVQGHTPLPSRFEANLEYRRVYSICANETNCESKNHTCLYRS